MTQSSYLSTQDLAELVFTRCASIEEWLIADPFAYALPFYCSVDIRYSEDQVAVVDTNLFPGGFNNLEWVHSPQYYASLMHNTFLQHDLHNIKNILLIPENHTRNLFYQENIHALIHLLKQGHYDVRLAYLPEEDKHNNTGDDTHPGLIYPPGHSNYDHPDIILLNNDLSRGIPECLYQLSQPLFPSPWMGWAHRKKDTHFHYLDQVIMRFCQEYALPDHAFRLEHKVVPSLNLQEPQSYEELARQTEAMLSKIRRKLPHRKPYVVLKSNSGTYGLGVICIEDSAELLTLNRKNRKKLNTHKGGRKVTELLIQEGIESSDRHEGETAEPVIYMVGNGILSGFYRKNKRKHARDNLNAVGASFYPMNLHRHPLHAPPPYHQSDWCSAKHYLLSVVARLATLAAAREITAIDQKESRHD